MNEEQLKTFLAALLLVNIPVSIQNAGIIAKTYEKVSLVGNDFTIAHAKEILKPKGAYDEE